MKIDEKTCVLVVGHLGMLGRDLMRALKGRCVLSGADCEDLDIRKLASVRACLEKYSPEIVVNAAAYTDVDGAESNKSLAYDVNATGAGNVAIAASEIGAKMAHISTDYVFDGKKDAPYVEDDPVGPASVYGETKLEGEKLVLENAPDAVIARTAWLYGRSGKNFVETILRLASERDKLTVVNDQHGSPTWTAHLAKGVIKLIEANAAGIYHVTNSGYTTWHGFASKIVELAGVEGVEVAPVSTAQFPRPAQRPANSRLDGSKFARLAGEPLPHWETATEQYMKERRR